VKKTSLLSLCCLLVALAAAPAFAAEPVPPGAPASPSTVGQAPSDEALESILGTPKPKDLYTYITWEGGTCTAWLFCTGEPYWKCQSTSGNCQVTQCSMTCNGISRVCPPSSNCGGPGGEQPE
jgi:hypothetical protein